MRSHSLLLVLVVIAVALAFVPAYGPSSYGYWRWGPLGILLTIIVVLLLLGVL
jgi:Co/Zn/Cd efflux system component